jgi:hypothetical protein
VRRILLLRAIITRALAQSPSDLIGTIDFYGHGNSDLAPLRSAVPFKVRDKVPTGVAHGQRSRGD